jgi:hypothetical protein
MASNLNPPFLGNSADVTGLLTHSSSRVGRRRDTQIPDV